MFFKKFFKRDIVRKVPEVIIFFWIIKLFTTAMGESTSDFMVHQMDPAIAVVIGFIGFVIAISLQLSTRRYVAWIYWLAVTMVAVFGTMAADVLHIGLGIPYIISTIFFAVALTIIFCIWYKVEKTLSIHSISTPRREVFYWLTVMTTFALGTAAGDMTAVTFNLGYLNSGILFAVLFALPLIAYKGFRANEVVTFWAAYIVTRPLGASFADWFGRSPDLGGIGFGTGKTSIVLTILILIFVAYLAVTKKDIKGTHSLKTES
ncbi:MAG: COG4705 family protein [Candidatus Levyibacteriota bacterium]